MACRDCGSSGTDPVGYWAVDGSGDVELARVPVTSRLPLWLRRPLGAGPNWRWLWLAPALALFALACDPKDGARPKGAAAASAVVRQPGSEAVAPDAEGPPPAAAGQALRPGSATAANAPDRRLDLAQLPPVAAKVGAALRPFVGLEISQDAVLRGLRRFRPTEFIPVGSTSTVFRTALAGPYAAAFKSATRERPRGPMAEVAAYRLARCLGLSNVPPAISRSVPLTTLRAHYRQPKGKPDWHRVESRLLVTPGGGVRGVMIYWIPDLSDLGLDRESDVARWSSWLRQGTGPAPEPALAAHISTMLVFDYLIGNFDRFSGSNARGKPDRSALYLRDHDVAFPGRLSEPLHRRILDRMLRAERFSRSFYLRLSRLDRACFEMELQKDPAAATGKLLSRRRVDGVFERLQAAKSHIGSLITLHGEAAVLPYP